MVGTVVPDLEDISLCDVVGRARAREKGWLPFEIELTISSSGLDATAVWIPDPNYQS